MFESITQFFKRFKKSEKEESKSTAKERLHLVLAQDRANISADFLDMMKQEILEVIKKYIDIDEKAIDVRLTNKESEDGSVGAPALYANIPIITIKNEARKLEGSMAKTETKVTVNKGEKQKNEKDIDNKEKIEDAEQEDKNVKAEYYNNKVEEAVDSGSDDNVTEEQKNQQEKSKNDDINEVDDEKKDF